MCSDLSGRRVSFSHLLSFSHSSLSFFSVFSPPLSLSISSSSYLLVTYCLPLSPLFSPFRHRLSLSSSSHHRSPPPSHFLSLFLCLWLGFLLATAVFPSSNSSRKCALGPEILHHLFSFQFLPPCQKHLQKRQLRRLKILLFPSPPLCTVPTFSPLRHITFSDTAAKYKKLQKIVTIRQKTTTNIKYNLYCNYEFMPTIPYKTLSYHLYQFVITSCDDSYEFVHNSCHAKKHIHPICRIKT